MFCCGYSTLLCSLCSLGTGILSILFIGIPLYLISVKWYVHRKKMARVDKSTIVGFFHPYCNAGGGGERVLWCAIKAMQFRFRDIKIVIYTGDLDASPDAILSRAQQRFNVTLTDPVEFVYLQKRSRVEPSSYPMFTLLGQSYGSIVLGLEALIERQPDIYIDTTGYAFTNPIFKYVGGCRVASYVHYPTVTSDMLRRVTRRTEEHNNRRMVARSPFLTGAKILYYRLFAWVYGIVGRCADSVMVNSTWTEDHVNDLWGCPLKTHRVYPPCDVDDLKRVNEVNDLKGQDEVKELEGQDKVKLGGEEKGDSESSQEKANSEVDDDGTEKLVRFAPPQPAAEQRGYSGRRGADGLFKIVSLGQFRPEKDHPMQLRSMYALRQILPEDLWEKVHLVFVGSCRDAVDMERVVDMQDLAKHLSVEDNVQFKVNVSYDELKVELSQATAGLHAMWNEHFGIGIVECMAAGLIMVAHDSGGPKSDIIETAPGSRNGYLATDESDYARALATIILMPLREREKISRAARSSVDRFSTKEFEKGFLRAIEPLFKSN